MAKKEKTKKTLTGKKAETNSLKATVKSKKKTSTQEQLDKLSKALDDMDETKIIELVPEEIKEDVKKDFETANLEEPTPVDFDKEVEEIFENAEPSEEVQEQVKAFEEEKKDFVEAIQKEPEKAEEIVKKELGKMEALKKQVQAMKENLHNINVRNERRENFTNLWNGMGYDL